MSLNSISSIPKAYAAILFLQHPVAGLIVFAATLYYPNIGLSGLLGAVIAFAVTRLCKLPDYAGQIQIFNSLLVGLSLGAFYQLNAYVVGIIALGAIFTVFVTAVLADWLWRLDHLPVFSFPFLIVAGTMALVARHYTERSDIMGLAETSYALFNPAIDQFLKSFGAIYFVPEPIAGLILFIVLTIYSRYLAMLAIAGYVTGYIFLTMLLFEPFSGFLVWVSFNFIMVAIVLGGIFTIPGLASLAFALVGVLFSALIVVATQNLLLVEGLPVMAISYATTALIAIAAMKKRIGLVKPYLALEPALPETNYEKARLAEYRNGDVNSVPLLSPVTGDWTIYQGFNGEHTHQAPWQHALDFIITSNGVSFRDNGEQVEDFYCFGAPVVSPAQGEVVRCYDKLEDNRPGEMDSKNNWGNFIVIRLDSGLHLLLAHLQQDSIKVKEGDRIKPGKHLANCGNSGRSPQPHLHLQVQKNAELGSPTYPFHLCSMMMYRTDGTMEYQVVAKPQKGERIKSTSTDSQLANQMHLPVGRKLGYLYYPDLSDSKQSGSLTVISTLLGQFRLLSDSGASAAFEENNGVLAFYDRQGPKDILLDMWVLANGLTPLTKDAHYWQDAPSAKLMPMTILEKLWLNIVRPLGCGLASSYTRNWVKDQSAWVQKGSHALQVGSLKKQIETISIIDPKLGCRDIFHKSGLCTWHAELSESGMIEDLGVPQWHQPHKSETHHNSS